ncbi:L-threonylcarbamoyladenylate synthase [Kushneria konosiri]|uniref:Threonylcarbamoyl-AMP synthase n=1 Tax=Kushneria konosiri TaxID=698828 RepID=A0A2Z2HD79_9GAMM|nr:Sua5/YciO/YrdC/YwlC family protein [Kushneria konosiri]ARS53157.1 tRNA threonylcarbamoyladenosine biosynthesis protein RimN [Kushneria konosiri]
MSSHFDSSLAQPMLEDAAAHLRAGGVVAYPTEAVWGLGCDPDNTDALERLLALKVRDPAKGLILIASGIEQFEPWLVGLDDTQRARLVSRWPGPVSWLVPDNGRSHPLVRGAHSSVALRVSDHPLVRALCEAFGGPLISSSANRASEAPCLSAEDIRQVFDDRVFVVDGPLGGRTRPSEIRDLLTNDVLRD